MAARATGRKRTTEVRQTGCLFRIGPVTRGNFHSSTTLEYKERQKRQTKRQGGVRKVKEGAKSRDTLFGEHNTYLVCIRIVNQHGLQIIVEFHQSIGTGIVFRDDQRHRRRKFFNGIEFGALYKKKECCHEYGKI